MDPYGMMMFAVLQALTRHAGARSVGAMSSEGCKPVTCMAVAHNEYERTPPPPGVCIHLHSLDKQQAQFLDSRALVFDHMLTKLCGSEHSSNLNYQELPPKVTGSIWQ